MKITDNQHALLSGYTCERLSEISENNRIIEQFTNRRNPQLVDYLKKYACNEDAECSTAFYIIRNQDGLPMLFFSLKCGSLHEYLDEDQVLKQKKIYEVAKRVLSEPTNKEEWEIAQMIIEKIRGGQSLSDEEVKSFFDVAVNNKRELLSCLTDDKSRDPNKHIVRVGHTHSGIELVHFCVNDLHKHLWSQQGFMQTLGKVMYWKFIIPLVESVQKVVGCRYLFLFAADNTEDGSLINYYDVELHLERPDYIGTNKPVYDLNCVFMCQEISRLKEYRRYFFNNFNPDPTEDIV